VPDTPIDRDKLLSVGYLRGGRTRNRVREGRDGKGRRWRATTDELGNTVTERHGDRQDVTIRAPHIRQHTTVTEER
jgi:hypothetical protein